jgi:hypothetical protein
MNNPTFRMPKSSRPFPRIDRQGEKATRKFFLGFSLVTH